jgi:hypothetical protein
MTHRRSPHKAAAKQQWDRFVTNNQPMILASGIPAATFDSIGSFEDFLYRGREIRVDSLSPTQYNALVTLTDSYFAAGYEWFEPLALRQADQDTLRMRFGR